MPGCRHAALPRSWARPTPSLCWRTMPTTRVTDVSQSSCCARRGVPTARADSSTRHLDAPTRGLHCGSAGRRTFSALPRAPKLDPERVGSDGLTASSPTRDDGYSLELRGVVPRGGFEPTTNVLTVCGA